MRHFGTSLTERCMNFIFDLYGTLIDIKTDEEKRVLWENVACELGEDRSEAEKIRSEYRTLCSKYKTSDEQEIDLLGVFEDMLEAHGKRVTAQGLPKNSESFRRSAYGCLTV